MEGNFFNSPNPNLRPEQVFSIDTGFKFRTGTFTGELFGFWSKYSDRILTVLTGNTVGGLAERRQENAASQIIGGIEFGGQWRVIPELALLGTATWTQGDTTLNTGDVVPADRIPPFNGIVGVRYESPAGKFYVEPLLRYAGAQNRLAPNNRTDNRINPNGTPGFFVFDVRAGMLVSESLWLRLVAQNLTNNNYREHGSSLDGLGTNIFFNVDYRY
ncbi:TonB-dependent receptor [Gloeobacter morelensis]|uniref:TonB-dependent receptor domain-containing protein n=1 Tax=Gloeobacter morelensis TaxID=2907343 RepID=UPI001E5BF135|nr:TonB-dependent receptor [Gloeobacter morelensis]